MITKSKIEHEIENEKRCCLCHGEIDGYGNNPAPLSDKFKCCNVCNTTKVIPARIEQIIKNKQIGKSIKTI